MQCLGELVLLAKWFASQITLVAVRSAQRGLSVQTLGGFDVSDKKCRY